MNEWHSKPEVKKGDMGEAIIRQALLNAGWFPYRPDFDGPHPIDRVAFNPKTMKVVLFDSKCKPARYFYADTGIDERHFRKYMAWNEQIPVFLGFVDEEWGRVYGNFLDRLIQPFDRGDSFFSLYHGKDYPSHEKGIVYFPLARMKLIGNLSENLCSEISALRNTAWECVKGDTFRYEFPNIDWFSLARDA